MSTLFPSREYHRYLLSSLVLVLCSYATMFVDAAVGGHFLGADAVSAINLVLPISEFFNSVALLLGVGASVGAAQAMGRNDITTVRRSFSVAITTTFAGLVLAAIIMFVVKEQVVQCLTNNSSLYTLTHTYLSAMIPWFVIYGLLAVLKVYTILSGRPVLVMCSAVVQFLVNIGCNLLFLGVFHKSIGALAISSIISALVMVVLLLVNYFHRDCPFHWMRCSKKEYMYHFRNNLHYGVGFLASDASYMFFAFMMNTMVLRWMGQDAFFIWSIVMMVYLVVSYVTIAIQETCITLGGRYLGLGQIFIARHLHWRSCIYLSIFSVLLLVAIFVFPQSLLPFFGVSNPAQYAAILPIIALAIPFIWINNVLTLVVLPILQQRKILVYSILIVFIYLYVAGLFGLFHSLLPTHEWWCFLAMIPIQILLYYVASRYYRLSRT